MYNTNLPNPAELPSTGKLLRSTAIAALIAIVLLVTTILPAERGIDPIGIGHILGLTQMGKIKTSLATETNKPAEQNKATPVSQPVVQARSATSQTSPATTSSANTAKQHTMTVSLKPGEVAEIKLAMQKDARVRYEWSSTGGLVNFDAHGDPVNAPQGFYHGYGKGRSASGDKGEIVAAFDGKHGWFWRNRSNTAATITLKTDGDYAQIKRVL